MKKLLSLILVLVMCLPLCACGEKSNEIELTLDNYDDYLKFSPRIKSPYDKTFSGTEMVGEDGRIYLNASFSSYLGIQVYVEGVSSNFLYSDIVLVIRANGRHLVCDPSMGTNNWGAYDTWWQTANFEHTIECDLDISGSGSGNSQEKYIIPNNLISPSAAGAGGFDFDFEIISISGKVTPAN